MFHIRLIGLIAGFCTTISLLPQIMKMLRTKHARDVSMVMYVVLVIGVVCWLVYGIFLKEIPLILANSVTLMLCLIIIGMKAVYGKNPD
ncbi:MAG: SemiSWEET transporter [Candidatus Omnitrophica bacterium]|nr:SemiSWEET transporter [Candidatus Omnitrophota bacterium]MBU1128522.1 SemiSWEET transporter [Candidatus Omnitrophota bacterium]MBU1656782.1 SemiSWEET transporter [Candidatus Omnitrophota bacterium]MBU1784450.1 SemiSWEET transporter [Candidatus Omnitrophota bacterium]MBU1851349.1 SemiSWEET transporter [Candidatus Omnitrophota bacterium]